tara:strand:- start:206 stop:1195 length:990 start_codon:yes stop_codon:yes gene_type:complete
MKIIAELCQNHNGDFSILKNMIKAASKAGASHIKIQHINPEILNYRARHEEGLVVNNRRFAIKRPYGDEFKRLSKLTLSDQEIREFINICNDEGVIPLTTCFSRSDVKKINDLGFREIKVASYDCSSYQLIRDLIPYFNHIYVSTGATYDNEVAYTSSILKNRGKSFSLLQCTTIYPTPINLLNLTRMIFLKSLVKDPNEIGFSDHSSSLINPNLASMLAIYHGAKIIERHFSILSSEETKDGPVSINEKDLEELVKFSLLDKQKQYQEIKNLGIEPKIYFENNYKDKGLSDEELLNRDYYKGRFATVLTKKDGIPYKVITNENEIPLI